VTPSSGEKKQNRGWGGKKNTKTNFLYSGGVGPSEIEDLRLGRRGGGGGEKIPFDCRINLSKTQEKE